MGEKVPPAFAFDIPLLSTYPKAVCSFINLHFKVCHVGQSSITTTLVFACLVSWSSNRSVSSSALC